MQRFLVFSLTLLWTGVAYAQTIHMANNNANAPSGDNIYATLQEAINEASSGDIIHVIPSSASYESVEIGSKALTILGIGFNPDKDVALKSEVFKLSLLEGSEGTKIAGLKIGEVVGGVQDLTIESCFISGQIDFDAAPSLNNLLIRNCYVAGGRFRLVAANPSSNIIITNNIFLIHVEIARISSGAVLTNNVFYSLTTREAVFYTGLDHVLVKNNILFGRFIPDGGPSGYSNNTFRNNIIWGNLDNDIPTNNENTETNNLKGVDPQFVNFPEEGAQVASFDYDFRLQESSPGKNAGDDGTDMGIFGGSTPFDPTGTPLPYVQSITVPSAVKKGTDMVVKIRARGN